MKNVLRIVMVWAAALAGQSVAAADDKPAEPLATLETATSYPRPVVKRPLVLYVGLLELDGNTAVVDVSSADPGQPFFFAPSLFYGVVDKLMVGVVTRRGVCDGCGHAFDDLGLHARYLLVPTGGVHVALEGGLDFLSFDAGTIGISVDAIIQFFAGDNIDVLLIPGLAFGLNKRDELGNKEFLQLDALGRYQVDDGLNLFLHVFYGGILDPPIGGFSDFAGGGLGVGATYAISNMFDVGAEFDFTTLFQKSGSADGRQIIGRVALRFGK